MKKLFLAAIALLPGVTAWAQQPLDPNAKLPRDPDVRIGRLDNGLTYYIRHNAKPAGMGEFRIVHNVGAIQEDDSQTGLARCSACELTVSRRFLNKELADHQLAALLKNCPHTPCVHFPG